MELALRVSKVWLEGNGFLDANAVTTPRGELRGIYKLKGT